MPWLKSDPGTIVISLDPMWPQSPEIWELSDAEYRKASIALHDRLTVEALARHERARQLQAIANRAHRARRRAHVRGAAGRHTVAEWTALVEAHRGRCFYCGEAGPLTRDHIVPLSRGGSDSIDNIVPACHPCNSRKGAR